jgi:hypothetical protein
VSAGVLLLVASPPSSKTLWRMMQEGLRGAAATVLAIVERRAALVIVMD